MKRDNKKVHVLAPPKSAHLDLALPMTARGIVDAVGKYMLKPDFDCPPSFATQPCLILSCEILEFPAQKRSKLGNCVQ